MPYIVDDRGKLLVRAWIDQRRDLQGERFVFGGPALLDDPDQIGDVLVAIAKSTAWRDRRVKLQCDQRAARDDPDLLPEHRGRHGDAGGFEEHRVRFPGHEIDDRVGFGRVRIALVHLHHVWRPDHEIPAAREDGGQWLEAIARHEHVDIDRRSLACVVPHRESADQRELRTKLGEDFRELAEHSGTRVQGLERMLDGSDSIHGSTVARATVAAGGPVACYGRSRVATFSTMTPGRYPGVTL